MAEDQVYRKDVMENIITVVEQSTMETAEDRKDTMENAEVVEIAALQNEIDALKAELAKIEKEGVTVKKNHKTGKANPTKMYVRLADKLESWGKIPQQQADIAQILINGMEKGKSYSEPEVWNILIDGCGEYPSITKSVQDVTYLFRYYRGLKNNGTHGGFIARNFIR